jgi:hypothetical protein
MVCLNSNEYVNDVLKVKECRLKIDFFLLLQGQSSCDKNESESGVNNSDLKYRTIVRIHKLVSQLEKSTLVI